MIIDQILALYIFFYNLFKRITNFLLKKHTLDPSWSSTLTTSILSFNSPELTPSRGIHSTLIDPSPSPSKFTFALPIFSSPKISSLKHFTFRYSSPSFSSNSNDWFQTGFVVVLVVVRATFVFLTTWKDYQQLN